jgi:hypothetical protein
MGLLDTITTKVVTHYKADASQYKQELRELTGEQKKQAAETIKSLESQAQSWDKWGKRIAGATAGAAAAFVIAKESFDTWARVSTLQANTVGVSIDKLAKAAGGLRSNMELLELASAGVNGRFKLTESQLVTVVTGMRALVATGRDSTETFEKIKDAILKGEVEPLKELGIVFDETTAKTDKQRAFLEAMGGAAKSAGGKINAAGDDYRRMGVAGSNAIDQIKTSIGALVASLAPMIQALADVASGIASIVNRARDLPGAGVVGTVARNAWRFTPQGNLVTGAQLAGDWLFPGGGDEVDQAALASATSRYQSYDNNLGGSGDVYIDPEVRKNALFELQSIQARIDATIRNANRKGARARRGNGKRTIAKSDPYAKAWEAISADIAATSGASSDRYSQADLDAVFGSESTDAPLKWDGVGVPQWARDKLDSAEADARKSRLESMFGPIADFKAYTTAFETLRSAATAAFDAWITGSESMGKAIKRAIAEGIRGVASDMLVKALQHGAYAIGSLAFGDVRGAAMHGKAAALFGAGALAAGAIAKGLGAGQSGGATGSNANAAAGIGTGGARSNANTPLALTVVMGDGMSDSSPRFVGRRTRRNIELARRYAESDGAVPG